MERTPDRKKEKLTLLQNVLDWVGFLIKVVVAILIVFTFCFRLVKVTGTSMLPNYQHGDMLLATSSIMTDVEQGDVVVILNVLDEPIIKRVIATEGQTVSFDYDNKAVLVDGIVVDETEFGLQNGITDIPFTSFEILDFPQKVPEGCVFVLGDNRAVSEDSRYKVVGMVDKRNILGKALFHLFPIGRIGPTV